MSQGRPNESGEIDWGDPVVRDHPLTQGEIAFWAALPGWNSGQRYPNLMALGDVSERARHGTLTGGATWSSGPNGFGALRVGSSDGQYADCGTAGPWMSAQSQLTVEAVCIPDATGVTDSGAFNGFRNVVTASNDNTGSQQFILRPQTGGVWKFEVYDGSYYGASVTLTRVAGVVYHLVGTFRAGSGVQIYVRDSAGNYQSATAAGPASAANASPVSLKIGGSGEQAARQWSGTIPFARYDVGYCTEAQAAARWDQFRRGFPDVLRRISTATWFVPAATTTDIGGSLKLPEPEIDWADPVNREYSLADRLAALWLPLPGWNSGQRLPNLLALGEGSERAYHGTLSAAWWTTGPNGFGAVGFVAASSPYVDVAGGTAALQLNRDFGIHALIRPATVSAYQGIISHGEGGWYLRLSNAGQVNFLESQTADILSGGTSLTAGRWYTVSAEVNAAGGVTVFVDGRADGTTTTTNTFDDGAWSVMFGCDRNLGGGTRSEFWDGLIGAVAVTRGVGRAAAWHDQFVRGFPDVLRRTSYRTWVVGAGTTDIGGSLRLTEPEIDWADPVNREHPLAEDMVAFWTALPGWNSGPRLPNLLALGDVSERAVHGTLANGPAWAAGPNGFGAIEFDGSNDSVDVGDPAALSLGSGDFTLSAWVRLDAASASGAQLVGRGDSFPTRLASIDIQAASTGKPQIQLFDGANNPFARHASDISGTGWRHVAGVRGGGLVTLYVDGVFSASATDTAGSVGGGISPAWTIGRRLDTSGTIDGAIGAATVHLRALPAGDVWALYDQARRGFPDLLRRTSSRTWVVAGGVAGNRRRRALITAGGR